jgi:ribokinase
MLVVSGWQDGLDRLGRARRTAESRSPDLSHEDLFVTVACCSDLVDLGPRVVVATLGARGAVAHLGHCYSVQPPFDVDAIDTTGAGDAFVGAFAQSLASGAEPEQALERACAAGALACTVRGAIPSMPTAEAVDALVNRST